MNLTELWDDRASSFVTGWKVVWRGDGILGCRYFPDGARGRAASFRDRMKKAGCDVQLSPIGSRKHIIKKKVR